MSLPNVLICRSQPYLHGIAKTCNPLSSLDKIAHAFGLTLSQMLSEEDNIIATDEEKALLHEWNRLETEQKEHLLNFLRSL